MKTWKFDGVDLSEFGTLVQLTDPMKMPQRRSENTLVPFQHGRVFAKKYFEQKTITLGIALVEATVEDLEYKVDALKLLFGTSAQKVLQQVFENEAIRQGYAEMSGDLGINRLSPVAARLALDFLLTDPFLRSPTLTSTEITVSSSPAALDVINNGTAEEHTAIITFTGPTEHPKIEHQTSLVWVQYDAHIANGDTVTIDCKNYTAVHSVSGNVINNVKHGGDPTFMVLLPGANHLHATDSNPTTGKAKINFYPPYL